MLLAMYLLLLQRLYSPLDARVVGSVISVEQLALLDRMLQGSSTDPSPLLNSCNGAGSACSCLPEGAVGFADSSFEEPAHISLSLSHQRLYCGNDGKLPKIE